jgi:WD40 repeat protein
MYAVRLSVALAVLLAPGALLAQPPTGDEAKTLLAKYQAERDTVVKKGIAQRFQAALLERADALAKKATAALTGGRFLQAAEALRQARWQLPYQAPGTPAEHVARIIGNARLRHHGPVYSVAFGPDGRRLATASEDQTVKIWDLGNGHEVLTYAGHQDRVEHVAYSPDGQTIASAGAEALVKLWDPATGKDRRTLKLAEGEYVKSLAFSRDGKYLFAGFVARPQKDGEGPAAILVCYEVASGAVKRTDRDFRGRIVSLSFSGDGARLAVGVEDGQVRLWQYPQMIDNPKQPAYWSKQHDTGAVHAVALSPDGRTLVVSVNDGVRLYNTPQLLAALQVSNARLTLPATPFTKALAFSHDCKSLFTGSQDGLIRFWDPATGQLLGTFKGHTAEVRTLALSPAGNQLASAAFDYTARLWDFDIALAARDLGEQPAPVWSVAFNPHGDRVVSAGDKAVRVLELAGGGKAALTLEGHTGQVTAALTSPDGKLIASIGADKVLRLWDAVSGTALRQGIGHTAVITSLDFSDDSTRIVTGGADRRVKVWDVAAAKEIVAIDEQPAPVAAVAFRPDGKEIAVGGVDQTIALYDAAGKLERRWTAHSTSVNCLAYSPSGRLLASGGNDGLVKVWTVGDPKAEPIVLAGHGGPVSAVAFRKDNLHVASGGADHLVKLWKIDTGSGKEIQTFHGHRDWVTSVAFDREGFFLVSGGVDRQIKVWEITNREVPLLAEHTAEVRTVAVSPDGKQIASGGLDNTIRIWDRATGALLASLTAHFGGVTGLAYTPDGKTLISSGEDKTIRLWDPIGFREITPSPEQAASFKGLTNASPYLFVTPSSDRLLAWIPIPNSASLTSLVECFAWPSGKRLFPFNDGPRKTGSLTFCANGKLAATGAADGSVRVWKLEENRAEVIPGGDWPLFSKVGVADLALTPDGVTLVATSDKGEVKIADVTKRTVRQTIAAHPARIVGCLVSPDGKRFVTVGADNVVKCWDLDGGKELRQWVMGPPNPRLDRSVSMVFTPDGRQLVLTNPDTTIFVLELP